MARAAVNKRAIAVIVAVLLAAVATAALFSYVRGVEADAVAAAEPVEVFVVKDAILAGMPAEQAISQGLIGKEPVPKRNVAEGAIVSLDQIQGKVATVNLAKGEQILAARFASVQETSDIAPIPDDRQAIAVDVALVPGVAGRVNVGDHVSVIAQLEQPGGAEGAAGPGPKVQFLVQDAEVLAIGQRARFVTENGQQRTAIQYPEGRVVATLAVTPEDAEKLTFAIFQGQLYFTLLPEGQTPVSTSGRTQTNAFE